MAGARGQREQLARGGESHSCGDPTMAELWGGQETAVVREVGKDTGRPVGGRAAVCSSRGHCKGPVLCRTRLVGGTPRFSSSRAEEAGVASRQFSVGHINKDSEGLAWGLRGSEGKLREPKRDSGVFI